MIGFKPAAVAIALSTAAFAASSSRAATVSAYGGVGQHATVMNNIQNAQRRNNAAISHVQNNIRSTQPKTY